MRPGQDTVLKLIRSCIVHLRKDLALPELEFIDCETPVFGPGSDLDSMALVHLVADLEASLKQQFGKDWILADERALSRSRSPFRSVGELVRFIIETTPAHNSNGS